MDIATRDLSFFKARKRTLGTKSMQSLTLRKTVAQQSVLELTIKMAKTIMAIRRQKSRINNKKLKSHCKNKPKKYYSISID